MQNLARTVFVALLAGAIAHGAPAAAQESTVDALAQRTHFHGIAFAGAEGTRIHLATHHGLWLVEPDGRARRVSDHGDDLMGFTPHPRDPATLYASGHPASGGNLGFVVSEDGGRSWRKRADGVGGPVDFHQMDASKVDPRTVWGVHGGLQRSDDGGNSWQRVGPAPDGLIALAASGRAIATLYAATRGGLLRSDDGGKSWRRAHAAAAPATTVHVTGDGAVLAYIVGIGVVRASEAERADGTLSWSVVGPGPHGVYILHLAGAADGRRLAAVTFDPGSRRSAVALSTDGGVRWRPLGAAAR